MLGAEGAPLNWVDSQFNIAKSSERNLYQVKKNLTGASFVLPSGTVDSGTSR